MSLKPEALIYTDGACSGNPGCGGWAAIIIVGDNVQELSGGSPDTTNNRMELMGVINGLKALRGPHNVTILSDSEYITNAFNKNWITSWKKNGWQRSLGDLANKELWQELDALTSKHNCIFKHVRGHSGDKYNERADQLAVAQRIAYSKGEGAPGEVTRTTMPREDETSYCKTTKEAPSTADIHDSISYAIQNLLDELGKRDAGFQRPCGAFNWCHGCDGEGKYPCVDPYLTYLLIVKA